MLTRLLPALLLLASCNHGTEDNPFVPFTPGMCAQMCAPLPVACFVPNHYTDGYRLLRGGFVSANFSHACICGAGVCEGN